MELTLEQTRIVGLTMELDLKAKEYNMLCEKLEEYDSENMDDDDVRLKDLLLLFKKNNAEIVGIKKQIDELNAELESKAEADKVKYSSENLFKDRNEVKEEVALVESKKENWFEKIVGKLRRLFKK